MVLDLFLYYLVTLMVVQFILEKFLIKGERTNIYTKFYLWVMIIFAIAIVSTLIVIVFSKIDLSGLLPYVAVLGTLAFAFRFLVEKKQIKETNSHISTIILFAISLVFTIVLFLV